MNINTWMTMLPLRISIHTAMTMAQLTPINSSSVLEGTATNTGIHAEGAVMRRSELRATFALQGGRTIMTDRFYSAPLRFSRSFRPPGGGSGLCIYTSDVSPGVLNGDHYHSKWHLDEGTHVMLSSTSATRLHPTPSLPSSVNHHFQLQKGAVLEYFPECVIPFKGSSSSLTATFHLEEQAILAYADVWSAGRIHRGESFQFNKYRNLTEIWQGDQLAVWDRFGMEPGSDEPKQSAALLGFTHTAALWMIAPGLGAAELELVRSALPQDGRMLAGASLLASGGIGVRLLGMAAWELQEQCLQIWNTVRPDLLGSEILAFRK
ncbi:urease accessory protein UreD [Paenibacillus xylanilyticus]|uniref:urease accessory protein UreD n=1 Tax=Paenibacillus xylanilyticus TaxID=248903 RepID=UPI0039A25706